MENQPPNQPNLNQQFAQQFGQQGLPNANAILTLGIISIVGCFCYGLPGLVCGIVGVALSAKSIKLYRENPSIYTESSYKNLNAGRICAIIGLSISAAYIILLVVYIIAFGSLLSAGFLEALRQGSH